MGDQRQLYSTDRLTRQQAENAAIIVDAAMAANMSPAFMLALAVTESSLRNSIVGDDGISIGLFQLQVKVAQQWHANITAAELLDPETNALIAMAQMRWLQRTWPGHTLADYAEAWTLGGAGRFQNGRRNPGKVLRMERAVADLDLTLDLNEVRT